MDAVHIDEVSGRPGQFGASFLKAMLQGIVVPGRGAIFAAEDEAKGGIEELESWDL